MSDYKQARMRDGSAYVGNQMYAGGGIRRRCAKCQEHKSPSGFRLVRPLGMCCPECQPEGAEVKKQTQCEAILAYLRKHKRATNMDFMQKLWISSPHKRVAELDECVLAYRAHPRGQIRIEKIARRFIRTPSGKRVVLYELVRA